MKALAPTRALLASALPQVRGFLWSVLSVDMPNVEEALYMVSKAIKAGATVNLRSAHLARSLKPLMLLSTQCKMECLNLWARGC